MMTKQPVSKLFSGLSAFPLTPTDAAGHLQADVLGRFLERIQAAGAGTFRKKRVGYLWLVRADVR
jgi:4-hydroxy-tetrahydrodipicolinate synthase